MKKIAIIVLLLIPFVIGGQSKKTKKHCNHAKAVHRHVRALKDSTDKMKQELADIMQLLKENTPIDSSVMDSLINVHCDTLKMESNKHD